MTIPNQAKWSTTRFKISLNVDIKAISRSDQNQDCLTLRRGNAVFRQDDAEHLELPGHASFFVCLIDEVNSLIQLP